MSNVTNSRAPSAPARARNTRAHGHDNGQDASARRVHERDQDADYPSLRAVVTLARHSVEGCDLASGILILDGEAAVAEASEPLAADLDRLQHELGEGPGLQACGISSIVSTDDLSTDARWPSFSQRARRCGIAAVVSIPLIPEREFPRWHGWLTLYSRQPGPFPSGSLALAQTLGLHFSNTFNTALHAKNLEAALASRDLIGQAKGIIMARKNIDDEQAFAILRQVSQHTNRKLRDIAETVVRSCGRHGIDEQATR